MIQRTVTLGIAVLSILAEGFTIPHQRALLQIRCGADDDEIDAYIDALVAGVEDSDGGGQEEGITEVEGAREVEEVAAEREGEIDPSESEHKADNAKSEDAPQKDATSSESASESPDDFEADAAPVAAQRRPNAAYRFLLGQGRIGHFIVMLFVWIAEFVQAFIPPLANFLTWILTTIFGADAAGQMMRGGPREPERKVNDQYAAFADRRAMRGKQKKKAGKRADQEAAEALRQVGSVNEAKYRYVSDDFLKRHGIGPYQAEGSLVVFDEKDVLEGPVDEDEDVDWVLEALTTEEKSIEEKKPRKKKSVSFQPSASVGLSNTGVTVGVGFSIGGTSTNKKKSKRRKTLIEAATTEVSEKRSKAGPRTSDREGGGGMMGRLRDLSSNNLVSRSLLGAYPRDALPPTEAASATGLLDLATKYGYGDWSDEDDDEYGAPVKQRKKRTKTSSSSGPDDEDDDYDAPVKQRKKRTKTSSSSGGTEKRKQTRKTSPSHLSLDFDLSSKSGGGKTSQRKKFEPDFTSKKRSSKMVRLPTERLREKEESLRTEKKD